MNTRILVLENKYDEMADTQNVILEAIQSRETERIDTGNKELTNPMERIGMTTKELAFKAGMTTFNIPDLEKAEKVLSLMVKDGKIIEYGEERTIEDDSAWEKTYGTEKHLTIVEYLRGN